MSRAVGSFAGHREDRFMRKAATKVFSPDQEAHALLDQLEKTAGTFGNAAQLKRKPAAKRILKADPAVQAAVVMRAIRDVGALRKKIPGKDRSTSSTFIMSTATRPPGSRSSPRC
jgi:hypothetical protein